MACELCHYYGYKYDEVIELDFETFDTLHAGMNQLQARETLRDFTKHDWQNMKQQARSKLHKSIFKVAYPREIKASAITTDKLKGIGVITPQMVKDGRKRNKN